MNPRDDFPGEMEELPFDDSAADAVFGASRSADSAPEEFRGVAELVQAARQAGSTDELAREDVIVSALAAAIGESAASPQGAHERIVVSKKFRTAKVTAAATAVLLLGGTATAAATGSLPSPVHRDSHRSELSAEPAVKAVKVAARHHRRHAFGASGPVASVNGVATAGTCGVAGAAGAFTLNGHEDKTFTVNVATTTTYESRGVVEPTFANVCVGSKVHAKGAVEGLVVTATRIKIKPPHVRTGASGKVASVNGVTTAGTCGSAGVVGAFTLNSHKNQTFTVNVDTTTTFTQEGVASPSFANVCVGSKVRAKGTVVDLIVTANQVLVAPVKQDGEHKNKHGKRQKHNRGHHGSFGSVVSVNGVTVAGTCGTAGGTGSFTITGRKGVTLTVNVDGTTKFFAPGVTDDSFADVCVGAKVGAKGDTTDTTVTATGVFVLPANGDHDARPRDRHKVERRKADGHQRGGDSRRGKRHDR